MKSRHALLLGCGDLGTALGLRLKAKQWTVTAVRRNPQRLPAALPAVALDYSNPAHAGRLQGLDCDVAVMTPTPASRDIDGYQRGFVGAAQQLLRAWEEGPVKELIFVSSTRVYGDHGSDWVDEETVPEPVDKAGEIILEAERLLLESRHKVSVVRFSGIYGRAPSALLTRLMGGKVSAAQPARFSNRIHRDDCIAALDFLLQLEHRQSLYLISDSEPTLAHDVEGWLAQQLGCQLTEEIPVRGTSRRCSNRRIVEEGFSFTYPDFRSGYSAMMSSTSILTDLGSAAT